jgi:hypothetical protein
MVNLYEFLGLNHLASVDEITAAIAAAEAEGKDAKLVLASRNILLNEERRAQYHKSMKFYQYKIDKKPAATAESTEVPKVAKAPKKGVAHQNLNAKQVVLVTIGFLAVCILLLPIYTKLTDKMSAKSESSRIADEMEDVRLKGGVLCGELAKQQLKYPGTYDRTSDNILATTVADEGGGHYSLLLPFTANNGFNVPVEHIAICKIDARGSGGVKLLSVN